MNEDTVLLPERLGRRMSVGPFQDPRDFLRFLLACAVGVLPATLLGTWAWLPFVGLGALLTLLRFEEESLWVLVDRRLRFHGRSYRDAIARFLHTGSHPEVSLRAGPSRSMVPPPEVFEHDPWSISGRTSGELLEESRSVVRDLALLHREAFLVRSPSTWNLAGFVPPTEGPRGSEEALRKAYIDLLRSSVAGKHRARLFLLLPSRRTGGAPDDAERRAREVLTRAGWERRAALPPVPLTTDPLDPARAARRTGS
ncbi:MAG: hypothetical protein KGJ23_02760 [Euryarchaeota archaeon]|nr:hypothetical protein [Euryarchaeota archaeon]MDE1835519.1 hypothetical protein [Euryarchaeota archaeon]MDE1879610.1 hypothetical protein [Euryarchaeota archaeon]MDE2043859.1 hypothetical protein [Thermoplasmata archaeon]